MRQTSEYTLCGYYLFQYNCHLPLCFNWHCSFLFPRSIIKINVSLITIDEESHKNHLEEGTKLKINFRSTIDCRAYDHKCR